MPLDPVWGELYKQLIINNKHKFLVSLSSFIGLRIEQVSGCLRLENFD